MYCNQSTISLGLSHSLFTKWIRVLTRAEPTSLLRKTKRRNPGIWLLTFIALGFAILHSQLAQADEDQCISTRIFNGSGQYLGCYIDYGFVGYYQGASDINMNDCSAACRWHNPDRRWNNPPQGVICAAFPIYHQLSRVYAGCYTIREGRVSPELLHSPTDLTEEGCQTYCGDNPSLINLN